MPYPLSDRRRPPLARFLDGMGAVWRRVEDSSVAVETSGSADPRELALIDLTALPRIGFKGRGTVEAMRRRGVTLEAEANRAFVQPDGSLCLVLAPSEVIVLSNLAGEGARFAEWERDWRIEDGERSYPLPRRDSHLWLALAGRRVPELLAKICAVDLRLAKFRDLAIAQTSVARMSAIIVRRDLGNTPVFHMLADIASALYLSKSLLDAAREFGGAFAGLNQLENLERHEPEIGRPTHQACGGEVERPNAR